MMWYFQIVKFDRYYILERKGQWQGFQGIKVLRKSEWYNKGQYRDNNVQSERYLFFSTLSIWEHQDTKLLGSNNSSCVNVYALVL